MRVLNLIGSGLRRAIHAVLDNLVILPILLALFYIYDLDKSYGPMSSFAPGFDYALLLFCAGCGITVSYTQQYAEISRRRKDPAWGREATSAEGHRAAFVVLIVPGVLLIWILLVMGGATPFFSRPEVNLPGKSLEYGLARAISFWLILESIRVIAYFVQRWSAPKAK